MNILDPFSKLNVMIKKESKMVPKTEECFLLLKKFEVPEHVIEHSRSVHGVALCLCHLLNRHGERLDQALVEAGSLLHDVAKVRALGTGGNHAQAGARLLGELGFPEVAEIVRQHVVLDAATHHGGITEAEVVHYSDKRVKHTTIVPLVERFRDLKKRYGKSPEALAWLEDLERQSLLLEERLFQKIPVLPEALSEIEE
jgi:putative nucleotidyltransferase with HDIG domain